MKKWVGIIIASALTAVVLCPMTFGADQKTSYTKAVKAYAQSEEVTVIEDEQVPLAGTASSQVPGPGVFLLWTAGLSVVAFAGDRLLHKANFTFARDEME